MWQWLCQVAVGGIEHEAAPSVDPAACAPLPGEGARGELLSGFPNAYISSVLQCCERPRDAVRVKLLGF